MVSRDEAEAASGNFVDAFGVQVLGGVPDLRNAW